MQALISDKSAILTVDAIGSSLGAVINSSRNIKNLLGHERKVLLGKNVTKLMPKVYNDMHSEFMLNFIKRDNTYRIVEKTVPSLNKNDLLVECELRVTILNSLMNGLALVGFIKKCDDDGKGLVMANLNTGNILGIDDNFYRMINYRISGKQIEQEEIKITSLMPEVDLEQLSQIDSEQKTLLDAASKDEEDLEHTAMKNINIKTKRLSAYTGSTLVFLEVEEIISRQDAQHEIPTLKGPDMLQVEPIPRLEELSFEVEDEPPLSSARSIDSKNEMNEMKTDDAALPENDTEIAEREELLKELPLTRKLEEFAKTKEIANSSCGLQMAYLLCLASCWSLIIYLWVSHTHQL